MTLTSQSSLYSPSP